MTRHEDLLERIRLRLDESFVGIAVEVFDQPTPRRRSAIVEELDPGRAADILENLSADQRTEVVRSMGENARRRCVPKLTPEVGAEAERLLRYPERTAGAIMTIEFVRLDPAMKVGDALKHIRAVAGRRNPSTPAT